MNYSQHLAQLEQTLPEIIQIEQLSKLIGKSAATIRHAATNKGRQHLIPPPFKLPNTRRLLWHRADVLKWMSLATPAFQPEMRTSKRGAPTKTERIQATNQGVTVKELRQLMGGAAC